MSDAHPHVEPYAAAIRKLLKGVVYHDDATWQQIRDYELPIREYLNRIGLGLHLDDIGSFAYLYDQTREAEGDDALPALTSRRELGFSDTLLLVLLRERLDEHETRDIEGQRLLLSEEDILDMIRVFTSEHPDARQVEKRVQASINRLKGMGFLTSRRNGLYEVRPLIRAKINADEMSEIKQRLAEYVDTSPDENEEEEDDDLI